MAEVVVLRSQTPVPERHPDVKWNSSCLILTKSIDLRSVTLRAIRRVVIAFAVLVAELTLPTIAIPELIHVHPTSFT